MFVQPIFVLLINAACLAEEKTNTNFSLWFDPIGSRLEHTIYSSRARYPLHHRRGLWSYMINILTVYLNLFFYQEELENTKGLIRIRISKNNRQHNAQKKKKDKQRSTKYTHKTKDRVTRTQLKTGGEISCSGRVCSSCSTSGTRRFNLVTNPVTSREWRKDWEVLTTST